tara:strand:+ start:290 stop:439 length:150 start_codon:yes stop_codon:yes gene_type:complete
LANASRAWLVFQHSARWVSAADNRTVWIVITWVDRVWHAVVIAVAIVWF